MAIKITELTAIDSVAGADLIEIVDDVAGTPITKKATITQMSTPVSVAVSGTSKTLALTDANTIQACTNAATQTITIPLNASVDFAVGTVITFEQLGAGIVTVTGDTGVTVNTVSADSKSTGTQYTGLYIRKTATNTWVAIG